MNLGLQYLLANKSVKKSGRRMGVKSGKIKKLKVISANPLLQLTILFVSSLAQWMNLGLQYLLANESVKKSWRRKGVHPEQLKDGK